MTPHASGSDPRSQNPRIPVIQTRPTVLYLASSVGTVRFRVRVIDPRFQLSTPTYVCFEAISVSRGLTASKAILSFYHSIILSFIIRRTGMFSSFIPFAQTLFLFLDLILHLILWRALFIPVLSSALLGIPSLSEVHLDKITNTIHLEKVKKKHINGSTPRPCCLRP